MDSIDRLSSLLSRYLFSNLGARPAGCSRPMEWMRRFDADLLDLAALA